MVPSQARFIEPPNKLKLKVGHGGISPELLRRSQEVIEDNPVEFEPFAEQYLHKINHNIEKVLTHPSLKGSSDFIDEFAQPIMGLKANGGMFQYPLISMIADVVLQFLDKAKELNNDTLDIVKAHNTSIELILKAKLKGYAGPEGQKITEELNEACTRYFKKHKAN